MILFRRYITATSRYIANVCVVCASVHTARFWEPSSVDLIFHYICPVKKATIKVEVESNGVPQSWHQQAIVSLMEVYSSYLMSDWENDESFKGI